MEFHEILRNLWNFSDLPRLCYGIEHNETRRTMRHCCAEGDHRAWAAEKSLSFQGQTHFHSPRQAIHPSAPWVRSACIKAVAGVVQVLLNNGLPMWEQTSSVREYWMSGMLIQVKKMAKKYWKLYKAHRARSYRQMVYLHAKLSTRWECSLLQYWVLGPPLPPQQWHLVEETATFVPLPPFYNQ